MGQPLLRDREAPHTQILSRLSKGKEVNIPPLGRGYLNGNVSELGDARGAPGKRCLFFLTDYYPEIRLSGDRVKCQAKHPVIRGVRCSLDSP
jgi:hypothetical protein